jgi:hypothetical protein
VDEPNEVKGSIRDSGLSMVSSQDLRSDSVDGVKLDEHESDAGRFEEDISTAIDASRQSAAMKRCYSCGKWTRNPITSLSHEDCPHRACSLRCLFIMDHEHKTRSIEMDELDASLTT